MKKRECDRVRCPVEACLELIGGKWKGVVLFHLLAGTKRFNELRRLLPKITQRMLTRQLRELENDGIVVRTSYPEVPPRVEYSLSELGKSMEPIIRMLEQWGTDYIRREIGLGLAQYADDGKAAPRSRAASNANPR